MEPPPFLQKVPEQYTKRPGLLQACGGRIVFSESIGYNHARYRVPMKRSEEDGEAEADGTGIPQL
jgi:hypothetical protein